MKPTFPYTVLDVETTTRSPVGFSASAFWPDNQIVLAGYLNRDGSDEYGPFDPSQFDQWIHTAQVIVGHNVKFDMHHLCVAKGVAPRNVFDRRSLWDTSVAHYLLSGMRDRMPSLDHAAERYKLGTKENAVSALIKSGTCPSNIPVEMLQKYLVQDVQLTHNVFLKQFEEAVERDMLGIMWVVMRSVCATLEMEYNGLKIDKIHLGKTIHHLEKEIFGILQRLNFIDAEVNPASPQQVSMYFFGGEKEVEERELVGKYKNGKDKFKKVKKKVSIDPKVDPKSVDAEKTASGFYTVDDTVLFKLMNKYEHLPKVSEFAVNLLEYREKQKILSTYGEGIRKHLYPGNILHPNINHNVTSTGRLSCSSPNLQNQADHEMRRSYVSGFVGGSLVEIDYAQLEIVGLCLLCGDEQLASDLKNGRDIHSELYNDMYGRYPTKEERKPFKSLTFGLVYGAGANTLAANGKISLKEAKLFIQRFYERYPKVREFHNDMLLRAERDRKASSMRGKDGVPVEVYDHRSLTGRTYRFFSSEKPYSFDKAARKYGFSPTELKNYPVQGFATGDIVPLMIGKIANWLWRSEYKDSLLLINTVHDSIMFDMAPNELAPKALAKVVDILKNTMGYVKHEWPDVNQEVPFSVEVKLGPTWYSKDMEVVHNG